MTSAELFHRAGVALFGEKYVAPLAALLKVEKITVRKWRNGKTRIPASVWRVLAGATVMRLIELAEVQGALERAMAEPKNKIGPPAG
jgi:hypothetical protein